jgi:hypothetical protein
MKQSLLAVVVVVVAVGAFAAGWKLRPVDCYQFQVIGSEWTAFNTRTGELYLMSSNGINRVNFPEARRTFLPRRME